MIKFSSELDEDTGYQKLECEGSYSKVLALLAASIYHWAIKEGQSPALVGTIILNALAYVEKESENELSDVTYEVDYDLIDKMFKGKGENKDG